MDWTPRSHTGLFSLLDTLHADDVMQRIWSEQATVQTWLDVESALAQAEADIGLLAREDADLISAACTLDNIRLDELWEQARTIGYPILPLIKMVAEKLPPHAAGRVHYGATTQDIMDTAVSLQLSRTADRLLELLGTFGDALSRQVEQHAATVMPARTHAQQAVPTTFGAKTATFLASVTRHVHEVRRLRDEAMPVSLFGAGGTSAALGQQYSSRTRRALAERLGLATADVPWHVSRDRLAQFCLTCAAVAATCVRFAREIVDLSRSEIREVSEQDGHQRGASSTMPQKANPIACEAIIGFGVTATSTAASVLRAMEAGHERSAGEWQIEWTAVPQVVGSCASALRLAADTATTLRVFPETMAANLRRDGGLLMSEAVMMRLADVLGRDRAYDVAYQAARKAREGGTDLASEFRSLLTADVSDRVTLDVAPEAYLGDVPQVCATAIADWQAVRDGVLEEHQA